MIFFLSRPHTCHSPISYNKSYSPFTQIKFTITDNFAETYGPRSTMFGAYQRPHSKWQYWTDSLINPSAPLFACLHHRPGRAWKYEGRSDIYYQHIRLTINFRFVTTVKTETFIVCSYSEGFFCLSSRLLCRCVVVSPWVMYTIKVS